MNRPIRKVAIAFGVLFLALFVNLNIVQVVQGSEYRNDAGNRRVLLNEYSNPRGQIVVDGRAIATSEQTKDELKYLRRYPEGPVFSTVTGYYSYVYGSSGIEQAENGILTGDADELFGSKLSDLLTGRAPKGGSIELTINREAQRAAYKAMGGRRGAVVAIDPKTGAILAMLSSPTYDPNLLSSHDTTAIGNAWQKYNDESSQPLLNRTLRAVYPPGSMFKVIDTAAALSADPTLTPTTRLPSPNAYHPLDPTDKTACPKVGGAACVENFDGEVCDNGTTATLALALAKSCNTTFAQLAVDKLGDGKLSAQAQKFGLDAPYPGDSPGDLCDPPLFRIPLIACHSTPGSEADLAGRDT
ncbi:MAG: penicillin-binding transpeptidase domain-containing protein, partial [Jatrophihabitans sp.]